MSERKIKTYYVTKWVLTQGILRIKGSRYVDSHNSVEYVDDVNGRDFFRLGVDVFDSLDDATRDAIKRADRKVASLQNQLDNMREMAQEFRRDGPALRER